MHYIDDIFKSISKDLKKAMKLKIKDIYPDMDELCKTFSNEKIYDIISKWYLDTINVICEKHIKRYPLKHFAVGYFHSTFPYRLPMYIYIPHRSYELYYRFFAACKHTLDYLIRCIQSDGLVIKIVDNDNNIYFYLSSIKFSSYKPLDMMSYFENDNLNYNWNFIYDKIKYKQFAENLLAEIQHRFNLEDCCLDYKYAVFDDGAIVIIIKARNNINIEISIRTLFRLKQIKDILINLNNNKSSYDIIMPYCKIKYNSDDETNKNVDMNIDIQEEIIKYIYSTRHLWDSFCEYMLAEFKKNCERKNKWFINIVDNLCTNPDVLLNDFYTAFSYFDEDEEDSLLFTNIYSY